MVSKSQNTIDKEPKPLPYKCACGRAFGSAQALGGHKARCKAGEPKADPKPKPKKAGTNGSKPAPAPASPEVVLRIVKRKYRCRHCSKLLCRAYLPPGAILEIRCPRCGLLYSFPLVEAREYAAA